MALALLIDPAGQGAHTEPDAANNPAVHVRQFIEELDPIPGENGAQVTLRASRGPRHIAVAARWTLLTRVGGCTNCRAECSNWTADAIRSSQRI